MPLQTKKMMRTTTPTDSLHAGDRPVRTVRRGALEIAVLIATLCLLPSVATSEPYQYVEATGSLHAPNVPSSMRFQERDPFAPPRPTVRVTAWEVDRAIRWFAKQHRLSPALLRAIIKAESDFNPNAVSPVGAIGLMQLMPKTAASLNVLDPFNPVENIRGGAKHLRYLLDRFDGNLPLAIAAYNAGEYRVRRNHDQIPPIQETQKYVEKVLTYYDAFRVAARKGPSHKPMF